MPVARDFGQSETEGGSPPDAAPLSAPGSARRRRERPRRRRGAASSFVLGAAHALAALALLVGWHMRDEGYLLPDRGLGYGLGIAGLSAMLLLLAYSARKRLRWLRHAGRVAVWFQLHMILGLAGPVMILYHCGFRLGSLNGTIALFSTLLVAASGVVGRLVHGRIHDRLDGRRASFGEVRALVDSRRREIALEEASEALMEGLERFEARALAPRRGFAGELAAYLGFGHRCRQAWRQARRTLGRPARRAGADRQALRRTRRAVRAYLGAARRVASFRFYERLFALWHAVHLPLCFLLFATAVVHIVAVHMY